MGKYFKAEKPDTVEWVLQYPVGASIVTVEVNSSMITTFTDSSINGSFGTIDYKINNGSYQLLNTPFTSSVGTLTVRRSNSSTVGTLRLYQ